MKKYAKSFRILVPCIVKRENEENGEIEHALRGFMCKPVFRVEDTERKLLEYEKLELPDFPLIEIAEEWIISVKAIPGNYRYYGYPRLPYIRVYLVSWQLETENLSRAF